MALPLIRHTSIPDGPLLTSPWMNLLLEVVLVETGYVDACAKIIGALGKSSWLVGGWCLVALGAVCVLFCFREKEQVQMMTQVWSFGKDNTGKGKGGSKRHK